MKRKPLILVASVFFLISPHFLFRGVQHRQKRRRKKEEKKRKKKKKKKRKKKEKKNPSFCFCGTRVFPRRRVQYSIPYGSVTVRYRGRYRERGRLSRPTSVGTLIPVACTLLKRRPSKIPMPSKVVFPLGPRVGMSLMLTTSHEGPGVASASF